MHDSERLDLGMELWYNGDADTLAAALLLADDIMAALVEVAAEWDATSAELEIAAALPA